MEDDKKEKAIDDIRMEQLEENMNKYTEAAEGPDGPEDCKYHPLYNKINI